MARPTTRRVVSERHALDYTKLREIVAQTTGWVAVGGPDGESAEVWHGDTEYVFQGEGLIAFLSAVKDKQTSALYAAIDLVDYIEKSAKTPPSVFVRDAIVQKARELRETIQSGENQ